MSTTTPRIAIIGAGPAGLTLASLLSNTSSSPKPSYKIFDLRPKPSPASLLLPSGSLDLHHESGLLALSACNLLLQFNALQGQECTEETIVADRYGVTQFHDTGDEGGRPEISRNQLTELLVGSVPEGRISWEHKILSVTPSPSGASEKPKWTVTYTTPASNQPQTETFDLIIGADGAWSRVRPLVSSVQLIYSSMSCIMLTIPRISSTHPHLAKLIGSGTFYASAHQRSVTSQRGSQDSARVYIFLQVESPTYFEDAGIASLSPAQLKNRLLSDPTLLADFGDQVKELVSVACDAEAAALSAGGAREDGDGKGKGGVWAKPMFMLPEDFTWEHQVGLTLMGDAAHLMTPFAGEGVNAAMLDALELSRALLAPEEGGSLDEKIAAFEKGMWERMHPIQADTMGNMRMMFEDPNAPAKFVAFFRSFEQPPAAEEEEAECTATGYK